MSQARSLSIVVPVYNEAENIQPMYEEIRVTCQALARDWELLFVDDGSADRTAALVRELARRDPHVRLVRLKRNYGQTAAMAAGFDLCRGAIVVSLDGDLQNDPADIPRLLAGLDEGYDVVCGWRRRRQDPFWSRRLPSRIANWLVERLTDVHVHDLGCSLKAYRASVIKDVALYGQLHRFIPVMSWLQGARVGEVEVNHRPRRFGRSKYGLRRAWRVLLDMITVKMLTAFASRPVAWFALLSLPSFVCALIAAAIMASSADRHPHTSLVISSVALLFSMVGTHLLAIGVLSELFVGTAHRRPRDRHVHIEGSP